MKNQTKNERRDATLNEVARASRRVREHAPLGGVVEDVRADGAGYDDARDVHDDLHARSRVRGVLLKSHQQER